MATHCSILLRRIPWTEESRGLQSMGSQRVGRDRVNAPTQDAKCTRTLQIDMAELLLCSLCIFTTEGKAKCRSEVSESNDVTFSFLIKVLRLQVKNSWDTACLTLKYPLF